MSYIEKKKNKKQQEYAAMLEKAAGNLENWDEFSNNLELELGDIREIQFNNKFLEPGWDNLDRVPELLVELLNDDAYLHFIVKYFLNIDLLPFQLVILKTLWNKPLPMLIATRGGGKTFIMSIYVVVRMILHQGCKVAVVGASLRQSMLIFNYITKFYEESSILQDICNYKPPKRDIAAANATWDLGKSKAVFLPLGNGEKIRGQRANVIIADEFGSINKEVFETVVRGFAAVKSEGTYYNVKQGAKRKALAHLNRTINDIKTEKNSIKIPNVLHSNQIVLAGTAGYQFNHFYQYYRYYKAIITTAGNKTTLKKDFPDLFIPDDINPEDYAILRIPYDVVPDDMMDTTIMSQGRATMDPAIFDMEYGTCILPNTKVITNIGIKNIQDIQCGDLVLTHKGRFKPVVKKTYRDYDGDIFVIRSNGVNKSEPLSCTTEHPFWKLKDDFQSLTIKDKYLYLSNLKELNNLSSIQLSNYTKDFVLNNNFIHSIPSRSTIPTNVVQQIRKSKKTINELSIEYNLKYSTIWTIQNREKNHKNKIHNIISVNYDLGLIFGYYAAEGSVSANGRAINFSLDGHVDQSLQEMVSELKTSIYNVFKITAKEYLKHNVNDVTINNRIIVDFVKKICPGVSNNKTMDSTILFSNSEFIRGFLRGYFNGDGHNRPGRLTASSCSSNLITQIKLCLSYFNISSSWTYKPSGFAKFRNKIYKTQPTYFINVYGENYRTFQKLFGKEYSSSGSKLILNDKDASFFTINNIENKKYTGVVYNLEVEEDNSYSLLNATVHNCFQSDSDGFYLASIIKNGTCPVKDADGSEILFSARLIGDATKKYVMGIDPASENDNFTINIIEINPSYRAVVYQFAINRKGYEELKRAGYIQDHINDYNTFCVTHIRDLCRRFNIEFICMDAGGGGISMRELLKDSTKLLDDSDQLILDMDDEYARSLKGRPILKMIEFSSSDWRVEAHHGLKKDLVAKNLLFPYYDASLIEQYNQENTRAGKGFDRLDDCFVEIEQCKQETTLIRHTQTPTGREAWDVPRIIGIDAEEIRKTLKKDRFTSLLLSNWAARLYEEELRYSGLTFYGGVAQKMVKEDVVGTPFTGRGAAKMRYLDDNFVNGISTESNSHSGRKIFY